MIEKNNEYSLLIKGDIKEFYRDEQKDIILSILLEELKLEKDNTNIEIINAIIKQNSSSKTRDKILKEIRNILFNVKNSQYIERLNKKGISIKKEGKHYTGNFFNDLRYTITIAYTASDINASHEIYRQIKNYFF